MEVCSVIDVLIDSVAQTTDVPLHVRIEADEDSAVFAQADSSGRA